MTFQIETIAALLAIICLFELMLWRLFRSKMLPLCFPPERDCSEFGFFRLGRMRTIAITHTIFLCIWIVTLHIVLW